MGTKMPNSVRDVEQRAMGNGSSARERTAPEFKRVPVSTVISGRTIVERKAPVLFRFETPGQVVEGILRSVERVEIAEKVKHPLTGELKPSGVMKRVIEYVVFNPQENQPYKILGTYDINSKLSPNDQDKYVAIVFKGHNEHVKKNGNAMMEFMVGVEDKAAAVRKQDESTQITDEDIPF